MAETIVKPTDSLNIVWSGSNLERILFKGTIYKWCAFSNHWVDEKNFYSNRSRSDDKDRHCKECTSEASKIKKKHKKIKPMLLEKQDYLCMICSEPLLNERQTHVDHCHKTGAVRGILCQSCNSGLGGFDDDKDSMMRAIVYAHKNGEMPHLWTKEEKEDFVQSITELLHKEIYFDKVKEID